ncbi:MAG TPA: BON domain-containing protein [Fimbriimonadaceae bacterium]|nr:BON domain-containing protein [Fimbriimonadaceae bacterium]
MKWVVTLLCAVALVGCNSQDADNLSKDAKNLASDVGQSIGGMTLAGKVNTALALRKDVDIKTLHVEAKDGQVTVTGHVKTSDEKGRVFDVVNNTVGVEKVDVTGLRVEQ